MKGKRFFLLLVLLVLEAAWSERLKNCECTCGEDTPYTPSLPSFKSILRGKEGATGPKGEKGDTGETGDCDYSRIDELAKKLEDLQREFASFVETANTENQSQNQGQNQNKQNLDQNQIKDLVHQQLGKTEKVQKITVNGNEIEASLTEDGYTIVQRRFDGSENFDRNFDAYAEGFGNREREHWLGLSWMHELTRVGTWKLRFELESFDGETKYAEYDDFKIGEGPEYRLQLGAYTGTAGNSLIRLEGMAFSTPDRDQDSLPSFNCAQKYQGGWWFRDCGNYANLNFFNYERGIGANKMTWFTFNRKWEAMKSSVMKIIRTSA